MSKPKPKILIYDIETTLLALWGFSLGQQFTRHTQLLPGYFSRTHIICITYKWMHERKVNILTWGESEEEEIEMIKEFDKLVAQADVVIGKNSDRFDNKHITTQRLWYGLEGDASWTKYTDDLEKQMRKHFYLPSYSLDYLSAQLGLGGKDSMQFSDWVDINNYRLLNISTGCVPKEDAAVDNMLCVLTGKNVSEVIERGEKAEAKMFKYGKKDTLDTDKLWKHCIKHFEPRFNRSTYSDDQVCKTCGSANIYKNGTRTAGQTIYQSFQCKDHGGYAGRAAIAKSGKLGKIG